jgi:hypothetical protein
MTNKLPIIYIFFDRARSTEDGGSGVAITEDGKKIAGHHCSSPCFVKCDLGRSELHKECYSVLYPDGYDLKHIYNSVSSGDPSFLKALKIYNLHIT